MARGLIPNKQTEYKRLGSIINDARLAGLNRFGTTSSTGPATCATCRTGTIRATSWGSAARSFRIDKWATQPTRVEVWIEKDALVGVLDAVCPGEDVPYFSCRGHTSQSEIWGAAQRIGRHIANGQNVVVLHLGDHDPSGMDMTREHSRAPQHVDHSGLRGPPQ